MERAAIRTVMVVMLAGVGLAPRRSHAETNTTASAAGAPDDHVEPGAATWRTLVLGSGGQLRLPPPPGARETNKEIAELRSLATQRDAAALERIVFWDAGPPSYRWNQIAMARALEVGGPAGFRIMAFVNAAIYDATVAAWDSKLAHRRPRPSRVARALTTVVPNPRSFAYPCEHAVTAGAASAVLAYLDPDNAQRYLALADEAARSRLLAGVASASDARAGLDLGRQVAARVIERARSVVDIELSRRTWRAAAGWCATTAQVSRRRSSPSR